MEKAGPFTMGVILKTRLIRLPTAQKEPHFFKAVSEGEREFEKIAIVGGKAGDSGDVLCAPCGVCRQVMMEFCNPDTFRIILSDGPEACKIFTLKELLPCGFGPANLDN